MGKATNPRAGSRPRGRPARAGRPRGTGDRHPGGKLVQTRPKRDKGSWEVQIRRLERVGRLLAANRGLWMIGRTEAAVKGTKALAPKGFVGPHVPALSKRDMAEGIDPIGRAWLSGLLEDFARPAEDIRDACRKFAMLYWRTLPAPNPVSGLYRNMISGLVEELPGGVDRGAQSILDQDERERDAEAFLLKALRRLDKHGHEVRRAFDQLVLDPFCDTGPAWLDAIIVRSCDDDRERRLLRRVIDAIEEVLL